MEAQLKKHLGRVDRQTQETGGWIVLATVLQEIQFSYSGYYDSIGLQVELVWDARH